MPTALRFDGLRVMIYVDDHRPAHVHVTGGDGEAVCAELSGRAASSA